MNIADFPEHVISDAKRQDIACSGKSRNFMGHLVFVAGCATSFYFSYSFLVYMHNRYNFNFTIRSIIIKYLMVIVTFHCFNAPCDWRYTNAFFNVAHVS